MAKKVEVIETQLGYKYFTHGVNKIVLWEDGKICIRPNAKQKKPEVWVILANKGLGVVAFNRMLKKAEKDLNRSEGESLSSGTSGGSLLAPEITPKL